MLLLFDTLHMCTSLHLAGKFKVVKRCVPCLLSDYDWQGWVKVWLSRQWKEQPRERWGRRQRDRGARGEDGQATLRRHLPLQQAIWHRHTSSKAEVKGENIKYCEEDFQGERHKGFRTWQKNLFAQFWLFPQMSEQFFLLENFSHEFDPHLFTLCKKDAFCVGTDFPFANRIQWQIFPPGRCASACATWTSSTCHRGCLGSSGKEAQAQRADLEAGFQEIFTALVWWTSLGISGT